MKMGLVSWNCLFKEAKRDLCIAGPLIPVLASQYFIQAITTMMIGHLGELSLSSTALAISFSSVTGFSFLMGLASGLETLCGQAYGAQHYKKVGTLTYTAMFCLLLFCVPLSLIWLNIEKILVFLHQDPLISHEAGKFMVCLIPALFGFAILQPLVRYFQMQSLILPLVISTCGPLVLHVPLCWAFVFKSGLGKLGGAVAINVSVWANAIFLGLYMKYSSTCEKTRASLSMELFKEIGGFLKFAVPSAVMICLEWWSYELLILLSGILPNPQLETSVLSICLSTITTVYPLPFGIAAAASTRISNELGAGNPLATKVAAFTTMVLALLETMIVSATLFACRRVYGYVFSKDKEVIDYLIFMAPLVCLSVIMDSLQCILSGIARGCGWQHIGAYVNLGAFYICGIPSGVMLAFLGHMRGKGLWIGILIGALVQVILLSMITLRINWQKQANNARKRLFGEEFSEDNGVNV